MGIGTKGEKMISKELLSEVLGLKVIRIHRYDAYDIGRTGVDFSGWRIHCEDPCDSFWCTSMAELAYKCKDWADMQKIGIKSFIWFGTGKAVLGSMDPEDVVYTGVEFSGDSEPEAIFKACEWIMKEKDKKCYLD